MSKLGEVVLLAGKNGSGKTRILNLIRQQAPGAISLYHQKLNAPGQIKNYRHSLKSYSAQLNSYVQDGKLNDPEVRRLSDRIASMQEAITAQENILSQPYPIITDMQDVGIAVIDFVPNRIELGDWANLNKIEWNRRADQTRTPGVTYLSEGALPLIQQVSERMFNATHPKIKTSEIEASKLNEEYERLDGIINSFLGVKLGWDTNSYSTLFGKPVAQAELSAGQKILLQLAVAIFAQGGSLANSILFMDEPENHLHPSAVIDLLDAIRKINPGGQIWIATHSIPLLSHFDASSLWYVENAKVRHSGKKPEVVLKSLLGDEERISKLKDFTELPFELARNRFAFECLCPPQVVETDASDPQSIQLYEQLNVIWKNKESIRLLDYGAGRGRMIANLADYANFSNEKLDYYAFDLNNKDKDNCLKNISLSYKDADSRYFNSFEELRTKIDDHTFDVVVMSNVLHEIEPSSWCEIFLNVEKLLKADGYLLLIEDCRIPIGELPHSKGFLVLTTLHLKKLFSIPSSEEKFIAHDARFDSEEQRGRLMAHLIPSIYLKNINIETIKDSLSELKRSALGQIRSLRNGQATYSNGLAHAFWVQQLANTTLCLAELGGE